MAANDPDELLPAEQVGAELGLTRQTVYSYNSRGILPADTRFGGSPAWKRSTVERYKRERRPAHRPRRAKPDEPAG